MVICVFVEFAITEESPSAHQTGTLPELYNKILGQMLVSAGNFIEVLLVVADKVVGVIVQNIGLLGLACALCVKISISNNSNKE
jgi:hypothetical protein